MMRVLAEFFVPLGKQTTATKYRNCISASDGNAIFCENILPLQNQNRNQDSKTSLEFFVNKSIPLTHQNVQNYP